MQTYMSYIEQTDYRGQDELLQRKRSPGRHLDVIFDGVADKMPRYASALAKKTLKDQSFPSIQSIRRNLANANDVLVTDISGDTQTHIAAALFTQNESNYQLEFFSTGTVDAYLWRKDGRLAFQTAKPQEHYNNPLGAKRTCLIPSFTVDIKAGDKFFMGNAGVTRNISVKELGDVLHSSSTSSEAMKNTRAVLRQKRDAKNMAERSYYYDDRIAVIRYFAKD